MIDRLLKLPPAHSFFLFGPRQTGKSTLLQQKYPPESTLYIDLLKSEEYLRYSANPTLFRGDVDSLPPSITHVIIDEVQRIPGLLNEVHSILESSKPRIFGLSGSSARKLKRSQANLLAGRAWTLYLHPLTHREMGDRFVLDRVLQFGSLPAVFLAQDDAEAFRFMRTYSETYLHEEIQTEARVRNIGAFHKFLTLAADSNGRMVNYSSIGQEFGEDFRKVKEYFSILEDTLIGRFLPPFTRSVRKRMIKHPKFLFFDTGIARSLAGRISAAPAPGTEEFGNLFEHWLILEIMRLSDYAEKEYRFCFYRTSADAEVDLIVETPRNELIAIEIKSSPNPAASKLKGLASLKTEVPSAKLFCACLTPRRYLLGDIAVVPWKEIFAELEI